MQEINLLNFIISTLASFAACFFSSLAGGGAGLILLPILILTGLPYVNALASHKLAVGFIGIGSSIKFFKEKLVDTKVFWISSLAGVPFVILGTHFSSIIPADYMEPIVGTVVLCMVVVSLLKKGAVNAHAPRHDRPTILKMSLLLLPVAFYSGWISSASGVLTTLLYIYLLRYDQLHATAMTLCANGIFWNITGAVAHAYLGHIVWPLAPGLILGALSGSYCGAAVGIKKGNKFIRFFFLLSAFLSGLTLLIKQ